MNRTTLLFLLPVAFLGFACERHTAESLPSHGGHEAGHGAASAEHASGHAAAPKEEVKKEVAQTGTPDSYQIERAVLEATGFDEGLLDNLEKVAKLNGVTLLKAQKTQSSLHSKNNLSARSGLKQHRLERPLVLAHVQYRRALTHPIFHEKTT